MRLDATVERRPATRNGGVLEILARLHALDGSDVRAGFRGEDRTEDGHATVVQIATWNNFGTKRIPRRPFMQIAVMTDKAKWIERWKAGVKAMAQGQDVASQTRKVVGNTMRASIQVSITRLREPPNAESTLRAKAPKTNPLINTGQMRASVIWYATDGTGAETERG